MTDEELRKAFSIKPKTEKPAEEEDFPEEENEFAIKENPYKKATADAFRKDDLSDDRLDALERDLIKAKENKDKEIKEREAALEAERIKEKEFYENIKNKPKRSPLTEMRPGGENQSGTALPREKTPLINKRGGAEIKNEDGKITDSADFKPYKPIKNPFYGVNVLKGLTITVVILGLVYAGGLIYMKILNDKYIDDMEKDLMGISSEHTLDKTIVTKGNLTAEEKESLSLSVYLPDTDKDGLSDDYELNVSKTDPLNSDSDGDKITDSVEVSLGLDPLTANDPDEIFDIKITADGAFAEIKGKPMNASATIDIVSNNSITGSAGIIGNAYEFYTAYPMQSCMLTLNYDAAALTKWNAVPEGLAIFRFNSDTLGFDKLDSTVNAEAGTVSAEIDGIGIYAVGISEYVLKEYQNRIFFLIDNSGSMYPEKLCPGSEENDVNFKRLDFASGVIDKLGDSASYGAAMFTGTYSKLSSVTDDIQAVKSQIDSIRQAKLNFDGTRICDALSGAADELGGSKSDKKYIILLTDGYPTDSTQAEEEAALDKVVDAGITVFAIGLGKRVDSDYLSNIASATNGMYYKVSNADALNRICEKIKSFMEYNITTVPLGKKTDVFINADSGFNADKDSLSYPNFRTDFSETGMDFAIAELTRQYFTGELRLTADDYYTDFGDKVKGYDINSSEQLSDGKPDLTDLKISFLDVYGKYLGLKNKWDYDTSETGLLKYNEETMTFIKYNRMSVSILPYTVKPPELEDWIKMLQNITFQTIPEFSSYECAVLRSDLDEGEEKDMMNAFRYMQFLHESSDKCVSFDFGYDGETAYNVLRDELTNGNPAVISVGGAAYNAVRLLRESENTNKYVLEAYNCNNPGKTVFIKLLRTYVYDGNDTMYCQYSAEIDGREVSLKVYKNV